MNKTLLGIIIISLIIGGVVYFGFRQFSQINNQLASLQGQLTPLIEKPLEEQIEEPIIQATSTATSTVPEEPSPEPKEEVNICESLDCNAQDGWVDSGSVFTCQNIDNQTCACQTQAYFDYSCSTAKEKCVYSTTKTRTIKSDCVTPANPDLIFQSLGLSPAIPVSGDQMSFWATLKNQGTAAAGLSLSYLKIDGQKIAEFSTASLAGNGSTVVAWPANWQAAAGSHEFEACADGGLQAAESNETNNCAKITFTVEEGSTVPLPDFIIESIDISPSPLLAGQQVSFSANVKNRGKAYAKYSLTVPSLDLNNNGSWDQFPGAVTTQSMEINNSRTVIWRNVWTSISGTHKIEICADAASESELRVAESNETNNCLSKIFTVP